MLRPFLRMGPVLLCALTALSAHPPGTDTGDFHLLRWEMCCESLGVCWSHTSFQLLCVWRGAAASQLRLDFEDLPK